MRRALIGQGDRAFGIGLLFGGVAHQHLEHGKPPSRQVHRLAAHVQFMGAGVEYDRPGRGDSGGELAGIHPGRVLAVYIRDVTAGERDEGVMKLREEVRKAGVDLVLTPDSLNAAGHAMAMGLITPGEYRSVLTSVARTYET